MLPRPPPPLTDWLRPPLVVGERPSPPSCALLEATPPVPALLLAEEGAAANTAVGDELLMRGVELPPPPLL